MHLLVFGNFQMHRLERTSFFSAFITCTAFLCLMGAIHRLDQFGLVQATRRRGAAY